MREEGITTDVLCQLSRAKIPFASQLSAPIKSCLRTADSCLLAGQLSMEDPPGDSLALQEAQPRRLIISEMVLENFKSYAGVQTVGPFHKASRLTSWCPRADAAQQQNSWADTCCSCRASPLWLAPMAVASPTS